MHVLRPFVVLLMMMPACVAAGPVEQWLAARDLAVVARQERDAVLLAAAGRHIALAETADPSLADARENSASLLAEAGRLAGRDKAAQRLVERYQAMINRGSSVGRGLIALALQPGESRIIERSFAAGQSAIIYADAAGPYLLDVQTPNGAPCRRQPSQGETLCRWIPETRAQVRILLRNPGAAPLKITLITN